MAQHKTLYTRGALLEHMRANRPKAASSTIISYNANTPAGSKAPNILFTVETGKYEPYQDEDRLLGETVPAGALNPSGKNFTLETGPNGNGVTTTYPNGGPSRHIQWLTIFGDEVARAWANGRTGGSLLTILPILTNPNPPKELRQATLALTHHDQVTAVLTTENINQLQQTLEREPKLGDVLLVLAREHNPDYHLDDLIRIARTTVA